jgi:hypothetical protein
MADYRVLAFGEMDYGDGAAFLQRSAFHGLLGDAIQDYAEVYADPVYTGAVLIAVGQDSWEVIQEFGTEGVSVVCGSVGNFKVEETPGLVIV